MLTKSLNSVTRVLQILLLIFGAAVAPASTSAVPASIERSLQSMDALHAVVVMRDGEIVFERSLRGPGTRAPANLKSLSKTVLSVLVGVALDRGLLRSVDQSLADVLGERVPADATDGVSEITIADALSLQTGLQSTSGRNYGRWVQSDDWVAHVLTRPMVDRPGGRMIYSTGSTHLLAAALVEAADDSLLGLSRKWLGAPLNIRIPDWMRDPQGTHFGGNEMRLSPRAVSRIGELYRCGGALDGQQVVSSEWVRESWTPRGTSPWSGDDYGYGWFITTIAGEPAYYGRGYGGQMLYVVPSHGMTIVITSRSTPPSAGGRYVRRLHRLVADFMRLHGPVASAECGDG